MLVVDVEQQADHSPQIILILYLDFNIVAHRHIQLFGQVFVEYYGTLVFR